MANGTIATELKALAEAMGVHGVDGDTIGAVLKDFAGKFTSEGIDTDTNTTYTISIDGNVITLAPSSGDSQTITLPTAPAPDLSYIAPEYSNESTYALGAYVIYEGVLYKAKAAIETAEEFDATHWDQTTVMAELAAG